MFSCPTLSMNKLCRNLLVMVPVSDQGTTEWLKKKSQEELCALLKQGNPQDLIPYATALTSQLNQVGFIALNLGFDFMERKKTAVTNKTNFNRGSIKAKSREQYSQYSQELALFQNYHRCSTVSGPRRIM